MTGKAARLKLARQLNKKVRALLDSATTFDEREGLFFDLLEDLCMYCGDDTSQRSCDCTRDD